QSRQQRGRVITPSYPNRNTPTQSIVYDVKFSGVKGAEYYITSQNNVVVAKGNRLQVVAKIATSNKANYPYVIYDDRVQMYIDKRGNIYSNNGRNIGYITRHT